MHTHSNHFGDSGGVHLSVQFLPRNILKYICFLFCFVLIFIFVLNWPDALRPFLQRPAPSTIVAVFVIVIIIIIISNYYFHNHITLILLIVISSLVLFSLVAVVAVIVIYLLQVTWSDKMYLYNATMWWDDRNYQMQLCKEQHG